jgi:hypothetical protein
VNLLEWVGAYGTIRGDPFSFKNYRFLRDIYKDESQRVVIIKPSQMGISELCINTALWFADTKAGNVLYCMPTQSQIDDFSQARVTPHFDNSSYLRSRLIAVEGEKAVDKVRLRKLGNSHIYFRGSDHLRQIISVDADMLIRDEVDFMVSEHLTPMEKRLGASQYKWIRDCSTPTYPDFGIHRMFLETDQRAYLLKCKACNHWQELDFFENVKDGKVVCVKCGKELNRLAEGEWVAQNPSADVHGYRLSRLNSPLTSIEELVKNSKKMSESDQQTFYNFDLGIVRSPKGGKLSRELILACRDMNYELPISSSEPCTMGVDVGNVLNVRISQHSESGRRAVHIGTVSSFSELGDLMLRYRVVTCCIDALPETRKAKEFADSFRGKVTLVYFAGDKQRELYVIKSSDGYVEAHCSRTQLLDEVVAEINQARNILPRSIEDVQDYIKQLTAGVRVIQHDDQGKDKPTWISAGADHYLFAEAYDKLASLINPLVGGKIELAGAILDNRTKRDYDSIDDRHRD